MVEERTASFHSLFTIHYLPLFSCYLLMLSNGICFYCQKCLAANPFGQELCLRCGTRLMLVIETPAARYEDAGLRPAHEEHLLERVSALENTLGRLTDKLGQVLDLLLRQAKNSYMDHALLETLIGMLCEAGAVDQESLSRLWRERCEMESREQQEASRLESLKMKILAGHTGAGGSEFGELIVAGLDSLWRGENDRALETLEYAAKLSPSNSPLYLLLAEKSFENGNSLSALQYFVCAGTESERDARLS